MRLSELNKKERVNEIVAQSLAHAWSSAGGQPIKVSTSPVPGTQRWVLQPLFSAYHVPEVSPAAARLIADTYRFTPHRWRIPAQLAIGTLAGSRLGLRLLGRSSLWVSPVVPGASDMVVVPGNRRVRIFDLAARRCIVVAKPLFPEANRAELRVRPERWSEAPMIPILKTEEDASILHEPLVSGFSLPRCPPWLRASRFEADALAELDRWLLGTRRVASKGEYLDQLRQRQNAALANLRAAGHSQLANQASEFSAQSWHLPSHPAEIELALSHGDFQAGNIFVEQPSGRALLVDWEYAEERSRGYDALVYGLRARSLKGFGHRLRRAAEGGSLGAADRALGSPLRRNDPRLAVFALEDLQFRLEEALSLRAEYGAETLRRYLQELALAGPMGNA
jgi:hypothetical protein